MNRRDKIYFCFIGSAVILAIAPLVIFILFKNWSLPEIILPLNFIGWILLAVSYRYESSIQKALDIEIEKSGYLIDNDNIKDKLQDFLQRQQKQFLAASAFRFEQGSSRFNLGFNLYRIVNLTKTLIKAQAVELSLYDEQSSLWPQALLVGNPTSEHVQSMLLDAGSGPRLVAQKEQGQVLVQPVEFSGSIFGALRVELEKDIKATDEDRRLIRLLANQAAIILIDARFNEELLRMREKSEESVKAKTGFLANLSHEIRGPLGIILNGVELNLDGLCGEINEEQRETLVMIKESGEHLLDLVNDVLDYAKVESGKLVSNPVELGVKDFLEDLTNVVRTQAQAKQHKLILEPTDGKLGLVCDKRHARQMLINLLTNAIKYTPNNGSITVSAQRIPGNKIKISVKDTGVGIADSEKHKVFGAFERVEDEYSLSQMGTGLGMPLTKKLAETNHGTIDFESTQGEGSVFWLILDACEINDVTTEVSSNESEQVIGNGETVLLIDNESQSLDMYKKYFVEHKFSTVSAGDGRDVLSALKNNEIAIAVIESDHFDRGAEELLAAIRGAPKGQMLPVILLSSKAFVFDIEYYLKLGVDRCISKPIELKQLVKTVRKVLDESQLPQVKKTTEESLLA
jgi:signal transduction histidine kinase/CheY-like chemotaxis protein